MFDYSTIDRARLEARYPVHKCPPSYRLQDDPGNGCYLDPPGYPTYFTRSVYTSHGNTPGKGATMTLLGRVIETTDWKAGDTWEQRHARFQAELTRLYKPLPIDHPRVVAWLRNVFGHFAHCYRDVEREEYGKPGTLIYPVPAYKLKSPHIDPHWTDGYTAAVLAEADTFNAMEDARAARIATVDNHQAVRAVRKVYPDFTPDPSWLDGSGLDAARPGDWWERLAERPSPASCAPPKWFGKHRETGWCQFCGSVDNQQEVTA